MKTAEKMESEGQEIIKLNIGNPAPWGFLAPEEILNDVINYLACVFTSADFDLFRLVYGTLSHAPEQPDWNMYVCF